MHIRLVMLILTVQALYQSWEGCCRFSSYRSRVLLVQQGKTRIWWGIATVRSVRRHVSPCQFTLNFHLRFIEVRPACPKILDDDLCIVRLCWPCLASQYPSYYHRRSWLPCVCLCGHLATPFLCIIPLQQCLWRTYLPSLLSFPVERLHLGPKRKYRLAIWSWSPLSHPCVILSDSSQHLRLI